MRRCIALSRDAAAAGEHPFAAMICRGSDIIAESINKVALEHDITRHAEQVVLSLCQNLIDRESIKNCTLYSNVEPCVMCSFPTREANIGRVVFSIRSPLMGGVTRWNVLTDPSLSSRLPEYFGPVPEIVSGVLVEEAERVWEEWNPTLWHEMKRRGAF